MLSSVSVDIFVARSITALDMFADRPLSITLRKRGLPPGSPPPALAATEISRMILVKILPRRASSAFLRPSIDGPLPMGMLVWRQEEHTSELQSLMRISYAVFCLHKQILYI